MKFKLDENFGPSAKEVFDRRGFDSKMVIEEGLSGASDAVILDAAIREDRILVTMDLDFADILLYPPKDTRGIAVLRPIGKVTKRLLQTMLEALISALERGEPRGRLLIVEPGRIREHQAGIDRDD